MILSFSSTLEWIEENIIWGIPLIVLILLVGIVLTISLRGIQVRHLGKALKYMVKNEAKENGEVSSFGALCISMAATLGTGKIIGVATAIAIGGPGALFWMILAAIFGMATKYAEGFLAIRFRRKNSDGTICGGPYAYIEMGMGSRFKWLAWLFAIFGALAGLLGIGTMTQMNSITDSVISVFDPEKAHIVSIFGFDITLAGLISGIIVTVISAFAVIGGISRISKMSVVLVPFMAITYFVACILIIILNIKEVPNACLTILKEAFNFKASLGGVTGFGIMAAMRQGVSKGIFSNEAGLGSSPIAMSSAMTNDTVKSGLVSMASTFIDTMVLCLTIGLGIVMMGTYKEYSGINITIKAFEEGLHISNLASAIIVMVSITTFAFTTIIGWNVYGEKCIGYLFNNKKLPLLIYKILYIVFVGIAPFLSLQIVWTSASIFNGLMAIPNLIALICLSGLIAKETKEYFKNSHSLEINESEDY